MCRLLAVRSDLYTCSKSLPACLSPFFFFLAFSSFSLFCHFLSIGVGVLAPVCVTLPRWQPPTHWTSLVGASARQLLCGRCLGPSARCGFGRTRPWWKYVRGCLVCVLKCLGWHGGAGWWGVVAVMHSGIACACCLLCCSAVGGQRLWDVVLVCMLFSCFSRWMMKGRCPFLHWDCVCLLVCGAGSARAPTSSERLPAFLCLLPVYHGDSAWCGALSLRRVRWERRAVSLAVEAAAIGLGCSAAGAGALFDGCQSHTR